MTYISRSRSSDRDHLGVRCASITGGNEKEKRASPATIHHLGVRSLSHPTGTGRGALIPRELITPPSHKSHPPLDVGAKGGRRKERRYARRFKKARSHSGSLTGRDYSPVQLRRTRKRQDSARAALVICFEIVSSKWPHTARWGRKYSWDPRTVERDILPVSLSGSRRKDRGKDEREGPGPGFLPICPSLVISGATESVGVERLPLSLRSFQFTYFLFEQLFILFRNWCILSGRYKWY